MAWTSEGFWTPENDDVLTEVNRVASQTSPLMKQAKGIGTMAAAKRGLGNSSIAIQSAQEAVLGKATEIGTAQAELTNRKNIAQLQGQWDYKKSMEVAALQESGAMARTMAQIASAEKLTGMEISSREKIAMLDREASRDNLKLQLSSDEKLALINNDAAMARTVYGEQSATERQKLGDQSAMERTQYSENSATERQRLGDQGAMDRTVYSENAATGRQTSSDASAFDRVRYSEDAAGTRQAAQISSTEGISTADREANRANAELNASTQLTMNEQDNATTRSNAVLNATTNLQTAHMQTVAAIMNNQDIPASSREQYVRDAQAMTEANIGTVEQITGTDLSWGNNTRSDPSLPPGNTGTYQTQADGMQRVDAADGTYYMRKPGETKWSKWQGNTYLGQWDQPV